MDPKKQSTSKSIDTNGDEQTKLNSDAFNEAEQDIEKDPELNTATEVGDDLDEGELARLEGEE